MFENISHMYRTKNRGEKNFISKILKIKLIYFKNNSTNDFV